jgi:fucose permease
VSPKKWAVLGVALIVAIVAGAVAYTHPGSSSGSESHPAGTIAVFIACWSVIMASRRRSKYRREGEQ